MSSKECGLTIREKRVADALALAAKEFKELEPHHPDEISEFQEMIRRSQGLLALRTVRRDYPDQWPMK